MLKPVIFLAFANARLEGHALLRNLPLELNGIRGALRAGGGATGTGDDAPWDLVERTDVTLDDVLRVLTDCQGRIAVFHYGGHAGTDELALESPTGAHAPAYAHGIAALLGQQAIPLVFLNGCSTQGQVKHLLDAGVQAVVATAQSIDDAQATRFATDFYAALAAGASLRRAFDQAAAAARAALGDQARAAYRDVGAIDDAPRAVPDEWPWALHVPDGAAARADWSLGDAIGDPLFGLPALPPGDLPPEPFRGLLPFTAAEARIFFGRGTEIRALYDQIRNPAGAPILLLYGQSGAGKSSLLDAGLLPRLAASGTAVRYARRDATLGLAGTLRVALGITDAATSPGAAWRAITTGEGTPGAPVQGATPPAARPLVVVLDQIEEVYTRAPADGSGPHVHDEVAAFLDALDALFHDPGARPPGRLVLAFRKDWLAEVEARLRERGLPYDKVFLERMDARGVTQAVTGVACDATLCAHYHLTLVAPDDLGREIAADLLADLTSPVAPTLQVLMAKLWAEAGRGGPPTVRIDAGLYHQVRTQGLALGAFVDEQIAALRADFADAVDSGFVLDLLAFHTTALVTAQLRPWRDVVAAYGHYPRLAALADRCEALSLLVTVLAAADAADATAPASADTTAEVRAAVAGRSARALSHDTLAPLVRRRFAESDRPGQRARRILESRLSGSPADARELLDRADLRMVEAGVSGMRALTPDEVALVARSARARTADRWIRRGAIAAGVALTAVVVRLGVSLQVAREHGSSDRDRIAINAAAAQGDPLDAALVLATLADAPEQPGFLQTALALAAHPFPAAVLDSGRAINAAAVSPDGDSVAVAEQDGVVRLLAHDAAGDGRIVGRHAKDAIDVEFSPDGRRLVSAGDGGWVIVWGPGPHDAVRLRHRYASGDSMHVSAATFDPSGHNEIVTASGDGVTRFWRPGHGVNSPLAVD
ncbi:MAG TPA: NACHT and WD repeat domain-containing protein, partial [Gemmatirosa sp.]